MSTPGDGSQRTERVLARSILFFRIGAMVQIAVAAALDLPRYPNVPGVLSLVAAVAAESVLLVGACLRRGQVRPAWFAADTLFCAAGLVVGAGLTYARFGHTWAYFMYPYSLIACYCIGVSFRRVTAVLAWTGVLVAAYMAAAIAIHHDPVWNVVPNALTYFPNTIVAWAIAGALRRNGRALDASRAEAVAHATQLARERERVRHARILHDRVLQTMETLARSRWISDPELSAHVAAEAAWLRALIDGSVSDGDEDLLSALHVLVQRKARTGLHVELNSSGLRENVGWRERITPEITAAVLGAVHEALTNVAKHAGVDTAVVHAEADASGLVVSVLDHGCGFDPVRTPAGLGLRESLRARIAEIGGGVRVESEPGSGTHVELTVPLPVLAAAQPPGQAAMPGE